jgi:glycosyltransferase involved in cell wall biosynthesis
MATPELEAMSGKSRRVLILGDPASPLTRERGLAGLAGGYEIYWYSYPKADIAGLAGAFAPPTGGVPKLRVLFKLRHLNRTIGGIRPDLIHVHCALQSWDTLVLIRFRPLVLTLMGGDILPDQFFHGFPTTWLARKLLDHADVLTSKSSFLDAALNRIGDYAHKIRRVTWGVDVQLFRPGLDVQHLRERWEIGPDDFVLFSPRGCQPFYNHHLIIRAFAEYLRRNGARAKLLITEFSADRAYSQRLRELVRELGLTEHVRFVGVVPLKEMPAYYNLAHVVISWPPSDGMPQSHCESMACGAYNILGDLPQYRELVEDGVNGRLVPVGDIEALAEAISWVEANPEHRQKTAEINRQRIIKIANKAEQERLVSSIYDELVEKYAA